MTLQLPPWGSQGRVCPHPGLCRACGSPIPGALASALRPPGSLCSAPSASRAQGPLGMPFFGSTWWMEPAPVIWRPPCQGKAEEIGAMGAEGSGCQADLSEQVWTGFIGGEAVPGLSHASRLVKRASESLPPGDLILGPGHPPGTCSKSSHPPTTSYHLSAPFFFLLVTLLSLTICI